MNGAVEAPGIQPLFALRRVMRLRRGPIFTLFDAMPLVSIALILLMFQWIRAERALRPGVRIDLPEASFADGVVASAHMLVVLPDGRIILDDQAVDRADLVEALRKGFAHGGRTELLIEADQAVSNGVIIGIVDDARRAGVSQIAIGTRRGLP